MIGQADRVLRLDAIGDHVLSLIELHDDVLDERGVEAWGVYVTDAAGHLISEWGDTFIPDSGHAAHRYCVWFDRLAGEGTDG